MESAPLTLAGPVFAAHPLKLVGMPQFTEEAASNLLGKELFRASRFVTRYHYNRLSQPADIVLKSFLE